MITIIQITIISLCIVGSLIFFLNGVILMIKDMSGKGLSHPIVQLISGIFSFISIVFLALFFTINKMEEREKIAKKPKYERVIEPLYREIP